MRFAPPGVTDEAMTYGMSKIEIFLHFVALLIVEPGSTQCLERDFSGISADCVFSLIIRGAPP